MYYKISDEEGLEFDLLKKGILHFYDTQKELDLAAAKASWLDQEGMEWEVLDTDQVEDLEPALKSSSNEKKLFYLQLQIQKQPAIILIRLQFAQV